MKAAKHGNIPIVDFFLSHGADINAKDSQEGTALHYAAAGGHLSMVRRLLKQEKGLLDIRDVSDNTALLLALHCGHASVAKYLLDRGADTSTKAPEDWTALHYAARKGYFYIARQILKRNKSLLDMRTIENDTALTLATFGGHIAIVDCLLSHGADIHAKDSKDWTSFHLAASEGHLKILQRLLKRDLEILELRTSEDDTALTLATYEGHTAIVEYLISRGADIYAKDSDGRTAWHLSAVKGHSEIMMLLFQRDKNLLETEDSNQTTALLLAGQFGRTSVANYLLSIGANIDARNSETDTAIHLAAESGSLDIVELILQARPDLLESRGFTGDTPISVALKLRHSAVFEFLFDKGADIIATNEEDDTPFHIAATKGHFQIIKRMLDRDPSILNAKGYKGRTAILSALMADHVVSEDLTTSGNLLIFEYLFEKGADISIADEHADLPLHFAVSRGYPTAVEQILERKPDLIEAKGHMGRTALSLALFQDQLNIVDSLLEKGADIAVLDDEDNNSLHAAAWGGHLNAAEEILKKKPDLINEKGNGGRTALSFALFRGHLDVFDFLFDKGAEITVDEEGVTPFHLAAKGGYLQAVEKIFRSRSDLLNSKDDDGQTALIKASEDGHVDVATYLLKEGADITLKSNNGRTALHMACEDGSVEICKLLLGSYSRHGSLDAEKSFITARDDWDDTALIDGSVNGRLSVVLLLLETEVLFPQYPANVEPYVSFEEEINEVETLLLARLKKGETDEIHERIEATIYWAILNGRGDLLSECLSKLLDTYDMNGWERGGFSCAHVAALGGHVEMMEQLLLNGVCTLAPTLNGISPFHLAVKYNRLDLVKKLIIWLGASPGGGVSESEVDVTVVLRQVLHDEDSVLDTILRKQDDDHTSISLAALGMNERHRELQDFLWDALDKSIDETLFVSPMRDQAHLVLELAAQYETPGDEKYLAKFLKLIPTPLTYHSRGLNVLHLAVHHRLPTVVWCLLSNGSYLSRTHIDTAQSIVSMFEEKDEHGIVTKDVIGDVIKGILESPPPLRRQQAWRREERLPDYEYQDQHEDWPEGTVLDFFREGDQASLQVKRRPMSTIIYTAGPHNIMKAGQYRNLKSLKKALSAPGDFPEATSKKRKEKPTSEPKRRNDNTPAIPMEKSGALPTRSAEKDKAVAEERRTLDLRWIHIHANNASNQIHTLGLDIIVLLMLPISFVVLKYVIIYPWRCASNSI
ncbi:ankyrin [Penicillium soppii]|uniref:ankyrin n=1 Tax=Penicillium soppii TaxID=69789 RepID=UPI002546615D|nr:ankyrin [Penicillium soppii]KAJ5882525.1 ankyrin [Penicillium soppii]